MTLVRITLFATLALGLSRAVPASAQPAASQHGTVSQTVNTTTVSVEYDRPSARGRVLFGDEGIVPYDALWTPGANRATILELSQDATVAGVEVPSGRYSVWTSPRGGAWTLILNRTWDTHHAIYPGEDDDVLRVELVPGRSSYLETLAFYFPVVGPYEATLRMHWGEWVLEFPVEVARD
jgi:hypothetical protein